MKTLTISKESGGGFVVDDRSVPGSPPVGRGRTMLEAIGAYFHANRARFDFDFEVDGSAVATEMRRRTRELSKR